MRDARRAALILGILLIVGGLLFGVGYEINVVGEGNAARARIQAAGASATPEQIASDSYHMANGDAAAALRWSLLGHGTLAVAAVLLGVGLIVAGARPRPQNL
jgi:hypothetical protein